MVNEKLIEFKEAYRDLRASLDDEEMVGDSLVSCVACEDAYPIRVKKELTGEYCVGCYGEINFGDVPRVEPFFGGTSFYYQDSVNDDESPWNQNCTRILEGD